MLKQKAIRTCAVIAACTTTTVLFTGCRAMPGAGLFAARGPSAEALAGTGPSTTYPVPPSHTATPEAIASIAGGTATPSARSVPESETSQVAGIEISPGYALPAGADPSGVNMAAAEANGAYSLSGTAAAPTFAATTPTTAPGLGQPTQQPSGYTFGSKALTPKSTQPAYAQGEPPTMNTNFAPPSEPLSPPSTATVAAPSESYTTPPSQGGFTLPTDAPAMASLTPPATAPVNVAPTSATEVTAPSFAPSFSAASAPQSPAPTPAFDSNGGYTPGSTGSTAGYPGSQTAPSTSGSFYR